MDFVIFIPCKAKMYQKLQFPEWPLEAGSKSEAVLIGAHVIMPNFKAEINVRGLVQKTLLVPLANFLFMTTIRREPLTPFFKLY